MKQLDHIERRFIFRFTRGLPLTLTIGAGALIVLAVLLFLRSAIPPKAPVEPAPAVMPPAITLAVDEIAAEVERRASNTRTAGTAAASRAQPEPSAGARDVAIALHAIRQLLPAREYAWQDEYRTVCRERVYGYCLGERRVRSRVGVAPHLVEVMDLYDAHSSSAEKVELESAEYTVNGSNAADKVRALEVAREALEPVEVTARGKYLEAWANLWTARERSRQTAYENEIRRVREERQADMDRYAAALAKRTSDRSNALISIGIGLTSIWMFGMALALLAIERNTRMASANGGLRVVRPEKDPEVTTPVGSQ